MRPLSVGDIAVLGDQYLYVITGSHRDDKWFTVMWVNCGNMIRSPGVWYKNSANYRIVTDIFRENE